MEVLINLFQREMCYPMKMIMKLGRMKEMDSWFHMHICLQQEVLEGKHQILAHLNLECQELMSVVSHLGMVDIKQIHR
jgi:hypothetical protein